MRYLIAFYEPPADFAARTSGSDDYWRAWRDYFAALGAAHPIVDGVPLHEPGASVTVRVADGAATVHDGPYADTKEQLGGFVVIDAPALDDALAWAERAPCARTGAAEVRPLAPAPPEASAPPAAPPVAKRFAVAIYETEDDFGRRGGPEAEAYWSAWSAYAAALRAANVIAGGAALEPPSTATVVRVAGDARTVHDGPYAETKEQLGGVLLLDVATMDEALWWASRAPAALTGALEVRPVLALGVPA